MTISIEHQRSANRTLRIVCPNGHLGFAPIQPGSFAVGLTCDPDLICADSGSCDTLAALDRVKPPSGLARWARTCPRVHWRGKRMISS